MIRKPRVAPVLAIPALPLLFVLGMAQVAPGPEGELRRNTSAHHESLYAL
jgi:hypothetical protein